MVSLLVASALAALAAKQPDDAGCQFKWSAMGCVPSDTCRLLWKPRLGTFGPCVLREPPAAAEPACNASETTEAEPTEAEAEPAAEAEAAEAEAEPEATEAEETAQTNFDALMTSKNEQLSATKQALLDKSKEKGARSESPVRRRMNNE